MSLFTDLFSPGSTAGTTIGGLLGAGMSAGASIYNNYQQMQFAEQEGEKQRLFNSEEAQKQRDYLTEMWNLNNAYNDPTAQMQRLRAAGLNPSLLYGQPIAEATPVSGGAEASASIPSIPRLENPFAGFETLAADIDLKRAQAEEIRSRIPLNESRVNEVNTKISNLLADIDLKKSTEEYQKALTSNISFEQAMEYARYSLDLDKFGLENARFGLDYQRFGLEKLKTDAEIKKINAETRAILARAKVTERELSEMIDTYAIRKTGLIKSNSLMDAKINEANATAEKLRKAGVQIDLENDILSPQADRKRVMMDDLKSDNVLDNIGGLILYGVDYVTNDLLGNLPFSVSIKR